MSSILARVGLTVVLVLSIYSLPLSSLQSLLASLGSVCLTVCIAWALASAFVRSKHFPGATDRVSSEGRAVLITGK